MGRFLRMALRAGNIREALKLSREARALENLNASGGIRAGSVPTQAQRGNYTNEMFLSDPDFAFNERYIDPFGSGNEREFYGILPDRRNMTLNPRTGARTTTTPLGRGRYPISTPPIEAPYEGFRVWPEGNRWNDGPIPPWQGAGKAPYADPYWAEFGPFDEAYRPWMSNNPEWHPLDMNVPAAFGGGVDPYGAPSSSALARNRSVIPFNEIMNARGSLFGDPRWAPPF